MTVFRGPGEGTASLVLYFARKDLILGREAKPAAHPAWKCEAGVMMTLMCPVREQPPVRGRLDPPGDLAVIPPARNWRRWWGLETAFVLLAGYLLFCHGCHGDEDNELFAAAVMKSGSTSPPLFGSPFTASVPASGQGG
jgi:hypothetical protein